MKFKRSLVHYIGIFIANLLVLCPQISAAQSTTSTKRIFEWKKETSLAYPPDLAGLYGGVSNEALILAGGFYGSGAVNGDFRGTWSDSIYVLDQINDTSYSCIHRSALSHPLAFGASVSTEEGVLCLGGRDETRYYSDVFLLRWTGNAIQQISYPSLPIRCAYAGAARVGEHVYVAGGQKSPDSPEGMQNFWTLDLSQSEPEWEKLPAWPDCLR